LITEEFDGPEPSPAVLDGLAAYVRSLRGEACHSLKGTRRTASEQTGLLMMALRLARTVDRPTAHLMLAGGRAALGRLFERYGAVGLGREQAAIIDMDKRLQALQFTPVAAIPENLESDAARLQQLLVKSEAKSLYNPLRLAKAVN
jgi:hypothetical protein